MLDSPRHFDKPLLVSIAGQAAGAIAGGADRLRQGLAQAAADGAAEGDAHAAGLLGAGSALRQGVGDVVGGAAGRLRQGIHMAAERRRLGEQAPEQAAEPPNVNVQRGSGGEPFALSAARLREKPPRSEAPPGSVAPSIVEMALPAVSEGPAVAVGALGRNVVEGVADGAQRLRQGLAQAAAATAPVDNTAEETTLIGAVLRQRFRGGGAVAPTLACDAESQGGSGSSTSAGSVLELGAYGDSSSSDSAACSSGGDTPRTASASLRDTAVAGARPLEALARVGAEVMGTLQQGALDAHRGWNRPPALQLGEDAMEEAGSLLEDDRGDSVSAQSEDTSDIEQRARRAEAAAAAVGAVRDGVVGRAEWLVHGLAHAAEARRNALQQQADGASPGDPHPPPRASAVGHPDGEVRRPGLAGIGNWIRRSGRERLLNARGLDADL